MIEIENVEVSGWEAAIRGMRNPMNSWEKSDSFYGCVHDDTVNQCDSCPNQDCLGEHHQHYVVGRNDQKLIKNLANAGPDHGKVLRFIDVTLDINAPLYFWKEFDTYKVGTSANSCSTMHKIHAKEFSIEDFSTEHLRMLSLAQMDSIIRLLNMYRTKFLAHKDKDYWWQLIQMLPSSYNQRRTVKLNYAVLRNMYHARKNHKLDEWHVFCHWIETLPYSEVITGGC